MFCHQLHLYSHRINTQILSLETNSVTKPAIYNLSCLQDFLEQSWYRTYGCAQPMFGLIWVFHHVRQLMSHTGCPEIGNYLALRFRVEPNMPEEKKNNEMIFDEILLYSYICVLSSGHQRDFLWKQIKL